MISLRFQPEYLHVFKKNIYYVMTNISDTGINLDTIKWNNPEQSLKSIC